MAVDPPTVYSEVYPYLDPARFQGAHAGKVVLVTGAARGIGQQVARHFAMAGAAAVAVVDVVLTNLMQTADLCQAQGSQALPLACDVSKEDQVKATIDEVVSRFGRIDILVNCAGVSLSKPILLDTFSSVWREMEINLGGTLAFNMYVLPMMKAHGSGCIINVASRAGTVTVPFSTGYSTSKAAVIRMTECIQKDLDTDGLGDKIQVYCCHPGAVQTEMSKRPMDPTVAEQYPQFAANRPRWVENFKSSVELCAATCVFVATGAVKAALKGRYFDCEHDMQAFVDPAAQEEILSKDLHTLRVSFLGGLPNDGGSSSDVFNFD